MPSILLCTKIFKPVELLTICRNKKPSIHLPLEPGQQTFRTARDLRYHVVPLPFFTVEKSKMQIIEKT